MWMVSDWAVTHQSEEHFSTTARVLMKLGPASRRIRSLGKSTCGFSPQILFSHLRCDLGLLHHRSEDLPRARTDHPGACSGSRVLVASRHLRSVIGGSRDHRERRGTPRRTRPASSSSPVAGLYPVGSVPHRPSPSSLRSPFPRPSPPAPVMASLLHSGPL